MSESHDVIVVGGGIAGLTVAWRLLQQRPELAVTVLEATDRPGGKARTEIVEHDAGRFLIEHGADSMLDASKPWARALCSELGLDDEVIAVQAAEQPTAIWRDGVPVDLPAGLSLLVPTQAEPFLQSPLLSPAGRERALREREIPVRQGSDDESLGGFVTRRFGREHLDGIAEPLLAGIYSANPDDLSLLATFPNFRKLELEFGSVTEGIAQLPPPSGVSPFFTLRDGVETIPAALTQQLGSAVRVDSPVERIQRAHDGRFRVVVRDGAELNARAVVLATPASSARELLTTVAPEAISWMRRLRTSSSGNIVMAWPDAQIARPLRGFGMVVPKRESQPFNAITVHSRKYAGRAPAGWSLLRFFYGGYRSPQTLELDDERLLRGACHFAECAIGAAGPPAFARIVRWWDGNPIYQVGHWQTVAELEATLPPGLHLAGSAYRGPGIPDVVRSATDLAQQIAASLVPAAAQERNR